MEFLGEINLALKYSRIQFLMEFPVLLFIISKTLLSYNLSFTYTYLFSISISSSISLKSASYALSMQQSKCQLGSHNLYAL